MIIGVALELRSMLRGIVVVACAGAVGCVGGNEEEPVPEESLVDGLQSPTAPSGSEGAEPGAEEISWPTRETQTWVVPREALSALEQDNLRAGLDGALDVTIRDLNTALVERHEQVVALESLPLGAPVIGGFDGIPGDAIREREAAIDDLRRGLETIDERIAAEEEKRPNPARRAKIEKLIKERAELKERLADVTKEHERLLEQIMRRAQEGERLMREYEDIQHRLDELRILADEGRFDPKVVELLSEELRARLRDQVGVEINHGLPFGVGGGIPTEWFTDCVAVALDDDHGHKPHGTGVAVSSRVVVTARHVADDHPSSTLHVYQGLDLADALPLTLVKVKCVFYPEASEALDGASFDIAVLVLEQPLEGVALSKFSWEGPGGFSDQPPAEVFVAGYGKSHYGKAGIKRGGVFLPASPGDVRWVDVEKTGLKPGFEILLVDSRLAARVDTNSGDSGGPVYFLGRDGAYRLGAITSRGVISVPTESASMPGGVYTLLKPFERWIGAVVRATK